MLSAGYMRKEAVRVPQGNGHKIGCANFQEKRPESLHSQFLHILSARFYKITSEDIRRQQITADAIR
jgi:hypothetical protein